MAVRGYANYETDAWWRRDKTSWPIAHVEFIAGKFKGVTWTWPGGEPASREDFLARMAP
jgi:hypothetical protein